MKHRNFLNLTRALFSQVITHTNHMCLYWLQILSYIIVWTSSLNAHSECHLLRQKTLFFFEVSIFHHILTFKINKFVILLLIFIKTTCKETKHRKIKNINTEKINKIINIFIQLALFIFLYFQRAFMRQMIK